MKTLIVVDMQNDFITGSLGTAEAVDIVTKVSHKIETWDGDIFVTQDTHGDDYLQTQEGRKLPVVHCVEGTAGWEIAERVRAALDQKEPGKVNYITKPTFGSHVLAETLSRKQADQQIEEIQLVGLCTDICVISNAMLLKAFMPETRITVDSACCAGVTPESHRNALNAMKMCQIDVF